MKKVIIALIFFYIFNLNLNLSVNGDNASYIMFSQGIVSGQGMVFTNYPEPVQSGYKTFTLPLLLSYFIKFSINYRYFKFISLFFTFLFLFLIRKNIHSKPVFLLIAFNPLILDYSGQILTENIYLFFSFLILFFMSKIKKINLYNFIIITVSFYFLRHLKEIGVALPLAAVIYYGFKKQYKNSALCAAALILILSVNFFVFSPQDNIYSSLTQMKNQYLPHEGAMTLKGFLFRVPYNFLQYVFKALPDAFFYPVFYYIKPFIDGSFNFLFILKMLAGLILLFFIFIGFLKKIIKPDLFFISFMVYFLMLLVWQSALHRYLLPVLPILIIYFYEGLNHFQLQKVIKTVIVITVAGFIVVSFINRFYLIPREWKEYFKAGSIISGLDGVKTVYARKPGLLYLNYGYFTAPYPLSLNEMDHYRELKKWDCNFIIIDDLKIGVHSAEMYLKPAVEKLKEQNLIKVKEKIKIGNTLILRIEL